MGIEVDATMGKENLLMKYLEINVKETLFNRHLLLIILKKCHL
jgi:hypothetical protein